ncbi:MAG: AAA family ATPase [Lachnospiraceae bacterium]|nr:AAA family ATPase [Lachnospiraceae bacterium]
MKEAYVVRILKSEIRNFKNVKYGEAKYMNYGCAQKYGEIQKNDIVGIYGQNGSGKTALIEALDVLKYILLGNEVPYEEYAGIISEQDHACLTTLFLVEKENAKYKVKYEVTLRPNKKDEKIELIDEALTYWTRGASWKSERDIFFKNPYYDSDDIFANTDLSIQSRHIEYFKNIKFLNSMSILAAVSAQGHNSVLFNSKAITALKKQGTEEDWKDTEYVTFFDILNGLYYFANTGFHIIKVSQLGDINKNRLIPFNMHYETETAIIQGCIPLFTHGQGEIPLAIYDLFVSAIKAINIAIKSIIPDLQIELENKMEIEKEDGKKYVQVEVYSRRGGKKFLTRYESEGIKRMISLLSYLVSVYNHPSVCLVVDELDSGIFEYLLGELLGILQKEMKGQLIFTSHNLRALEKLDYKNIICSTTNPNNRYITLVGVGANNNNRDFYIRSITIGGQKETLYDDEELDSIGYAFRKAGNPGKETVKLHFSEDILKKIKEEKENANA